MLRASVAVILALTFVSSAYAQFVRTDAFKYTGVRTYTQGGSLVQTCQVNGCKQWDDLADAEADNALLASVVVNPADTSIASVTVTFDTPLDGTLPELAVISGYEFTIHDTTNFRVSGIPNAQTVDPTVTPGASTGTGTLLTAGYQCGIEPGCRYGNFDSPGCTLNAPCPYDQVFGDANNNWGLDGVLSEDVGVPVVEFDVELTIGSRFVPQFQFTTLALHYEIVAQVYAVNPPSLPAATYDSSTIVTVTGVGFNYVTHCSWNNGAILTPATQDATNPTLQVTCPVPSGFQSGIYSLTLRDSSNDDLPSHLQFPFAALASRVANSPIPSGFTQSPGPVSASWVEEQGGFAVFDTGALAIDTTLLSITGWNFNIPSHALVTGIDFTYNRFRSGQFSDVMYDRVVAIAGTFGDSFTDNGASGNYATPEIWPRVFVHEERETVTRPTGQPADLWGYPSADPTVFNDPTFGFLIGCRSEGINNHANINVYSTQVAINEPSSANIYYSQPYAVTGLAPMTAALDASTDVVVQLNDHSETTTTNVECNFGGEVVAASYVDDGADTVTCTVPAAALATAFASCTDSCEISFSVSIDGGATSTSFPGFTITFPQAAITGISPNNGLIDGGTLVTLSGNNFRDSGNGVCSFDGSQVTASFVGGDVVCQAPPHAAHPGVTVDYSNDGTVFSSATALFEYQDLVVSTIAPPTGDVAVVTPVTVNCPGAKDAAGAPSGMCRFGDGGPATWKTTPTSQAAGVWECPSPDTAAGVLQVSISNTGQDTDFATSSEVFTIQETQAPATIAAVDPFSPTNGHLTGGTWIRVLGTNFFENSENFTLGCRFGDFVPGETEPSSVNFAFGKFVTESEMLCRTPDFTLFTSTDVVTTNVCVSNNMIEWACSSQTFTAQTPSTVGAFPRQVSSSGGEEVRVHGNFFLDNDDLYCSFKDLVNDTVTGVSTATFVSAQRVDCVTPATTDGTILAVRITNNNQQASNAQEIEVYDEPSSGGLGELIAEIIIIIIAAGGCGGTTGAVLIYMRRQRATKHGVVSGDTEGQSEGGEDTSEGFDEVRDSA